MKPNHPLVAIAGGSGAGKSWMCERLGRLLGAQAGRLSLDNFYRDRSHLPPGRRERLNFDSPYAIDWPEAERALGDCRAGRTTRVPRYDFSTHCRLNDALRCEPRPLVMVDGLLVLAHARVRRLFDLKIYLDCPPPLRLQRRLARDIAERGRSAEAVKRQFLTSVTPMHTRYVEPQQRWADLVITQPFRKANLLQLADRLWHLLTPTAPLPPWLRIPFSHELLSLLECRDDDRPRPSG